MTVALCTNCGKFKFGSWTTCDSCGDEDYDAELSLVLTDHHLTEDEMKVIGKAIGIIANSTQNKRIHFLLLAYYVAQKWPKLLEYNVHSVDPDLQMQVDRLYYRWLHDQPGQSETADREPRQMSLFEDLQPDEYEDAETSRPTANGGNGKHEPSDSRPSQAQRKVLLDTFARLRRTTRSREDRVAEHGMDLRVNLPRRALSAFAAVLGVILLLANMLSGLVAAIWLVYLRDWSTLGIGTILFLLSTKVPLALIPQALLLPLITSAMEREKRGLLTSIAVLGNAYIAAVILLWSGCVLYLLTPASSRAALLPTLLLSYGIATGPWAALAARESEDSPVQTVAVVMSQVGYLAVVVAIMTSAITGFWEAVRVLTAFMAIGLGIQAFLAYRIAPLLFRSAQGRSLDS